MNVYRRQIDGKDHFYAFPTLYIPRAAIEEDRHPMYRGWEMQGDLTATAGETIDFQVIEDEIRLETPGRNVAAVVADPWQANYLIQNLQRDGHPAEEMRQTVANMSEATKTLDALMREGRIHHPGNAVLNWMIGNVVGHFDAKDNVYPRKELPQNKIDGAVALIMALGLVRPEPGTRQAVIPRNRRSDYPLGGQMVTFSIGGWSWPRWGKGSSHGDNFIREPIFLGVGSSRAGKKVDRGTALQTSAILCGARVISQGLAQVPLKVYREEDGEERQTRKPARDAPIYRLLAEQPNDFQTSFSFRETLILHAVIGGDGYAFINRRRTGRCGNCFRSRRTRLSRSGTMTARN